MDFQEIIDKYYPAGTRLRDIYMAHCRSVADEALVIACRCRLSVGREEIESAAMLHDIGIFDTDAPSIECHGAHPYICHGVIGRDLLLKEGVSSVIAEVAARHTGAGLTAEEIAVRKLPLPVADYCPHTLLEKLICYADKFYSKSGDMKRKPVDRIRMQMARFGSDSLWRFDELHRQFSSQAK